MKNKQYIIKLILVFGLISAVSCTEDFEEINTDPNAFNEAPAANAFAGVVKETLDMVGGNLNERWGIHWANYTGGTGGQNARYGFNDGTVADRWRDTFVRVLKNNEEIIVNHGDDPAFANRVQIAKIWKSYMYSVAVALWGGVPMSDAFGLESTVNYDTEEAIYTAILGMLEEAAGAIDPSGDSFSSDLVYGGDNNKWIKFANTLRLKIALRASYGFPGLAQSHVQAVMANEDGLIGSPSENANLQWGTNEENWNIFYERFIFGEVNPDSEIYVNHNFLLLLRTYEDPRMDALVEEATEPLSIVDLVYASGSTTQLIPVRYGIPKYGKRLWSTSLDAWDLNNNDDPYEGIDSGFYSQPNQETFFRADAIFNIITVAEVNFMKAEAALKGWGGNSSAEEYYYAGIAASFLYNNVGGVAEYIERDGIKWNTASEGLRDMWAITSSGITADGMDKIVRQRWIAMYWQGIDAWALMKRTRGITIPPHTGPDAAGSSGDWANIPERMVYDVNEGSINPTGYATGLSNLGGPDHMQTPIIMNKPGENIDWPSLPAEYNTDFARHWYGDSEDDLINAGVPYEKL